MEKYATITLNEFRRRYFSGSTRPSKAAVVSWIEDGTEEGRKLRATSLNGRYYIREIDADEFLNPPQEIKRKTPASRRLEAQQARIANARRILATKYGFIL